MDHPISKLDECVFDYLAAHADQLKSIQQIYHDISGSTGHRCSELGNSMRRNEYRNRFISVCYTLDHDYTNIRKLFRGNNLYLVFNKDGNYRNNSYYDNDDSIFVDHPPIEVNPEWNNVSNVAVDYLLQEQTFRFPDSYYYNRWDAHDSILHIVVREGRVADLCRLLENRIIDIDTKNRLGQTPLDIAVAKGDTNMMKILMDYKYGKTIENLRNEIKDLQRITNMQPVQPVQPIQYTQKKCRTRNRRVQGYADLDDIPNSISSQCDRVAKYIGYGVEISIGLYIASYFIL